MPRLSRHIPVRDYVVAALLILGILWFAYLIWGIIPKEERARQATRETKEQLASLEAREATLHKDLAALDTPRGKEAVLRDTKGVALPGEEVIIVVPPAAATTSTTTPSWWEEVLDWF
jgi:hypothetical protein